jgi:hypothetical protein
MIYFAAIPETDLLPPLPSGTFMITVTKYAYSADLPNMPFTERSPEVPAPAPGPAVPPAVPSAPANPEGGRPRSDSDLARELQVR